MSSGRILFEQERKDMAEAIEMTYYRKNTNIFLIVYNFYIDLISK